jgi:hypothetical protein
VPAGNCGEALIQVADELCAELGYAGTEEIPWARSTGTEEGPMAGTLSPEDESLASGLRDALAKIATALGARPDDPRARQVLVALDGAEMAIGGELLSGNRQQLPRLMPSLVFLVALPIVEQDRALELSRRTAELIEG